jgi:hypothetical protein
MTTTAILRAALPALDLGDVACCLAGLAAAGVVASGLRDHQMGARRCRPVEPRQHAGRGVAVDAGIVDRGIDAPGPQQGLQARRPRRALADARSRRIAGAQRAD